MRANFKNRANVASIVGVVVAILVGIHFGLRQKVTLALAVFTAIALAGFWLVVFEDVLNPKNRE
jgi:hypothetical protein